jgi:hypothetical protein
MSAIASMPITFGRYKGSHICDLPEEYLKWVWREICVKCGTMPANETLRRAVEAELRERGCPVSQVRPSPKENVQRNGSTTNNPYATYLSERTGRGGWSHRFHDYRPAFTSEEGDLLGFLLNLGRNKADTEGWILAQPHFIEDWLHMEDEQQAALLTSLADKNVVEVETRKGRRVVRIDVERIENLIEESRRNGE